MWPVLSLVVTENDTEPEQQAARNELTSCYVSNTWRNTDKMVYHCVTSLVTLLKLIDTYNHCTVYLIV